MPNHTALKASCEQLRIDMLQLIRYIEELENTPEDEAAYGIMRRIRCMAETMDSARRAGSDDRGNDVLDAYEAVANAIRAAKEDA